MWTITWIQYTSICCLAPMATAEALVAKEQWNTSHASPVQHSTCTNVWTQQLMTIPCRAVLRSTTACKVSIYAQASSYVQRLRRRHFIMASNHGRPQKHHLVSNCCKHQWYRMWRAGPSLLWRATLLWHVQVARVSRCSDLPHLCHANDNKNDYNDDNKTDHFNPCTIAWGNKVQSGLFICRKAHTSLPTHTPCVNLWDNYILEQSQTHH